MVAGEQPLRSLHIVERPSKEAPGTKNAEGTLPLQLGSSPKLQKDSLWSSFVAGYCFGEDHRAFHIQHGASRYHTSIAAEDH